MDNFIVQRQVHGIVAVARQRNAALDISGALVFTQGHFAQVLEGPSEAIAEMMVSLNADERHTNIDIIRRVEIDERCFAGWEMAYSGPSSYVAGHIRPLLGEISSGLKRLEAGDQLLHMMQEFDR